MAENWDLTRVLAQAYSLLTPAYKALWRGDLEAATREHRKESEFFLDRFNEKKRELGR